MVEEIDRSHAMTLFDTGPLDFHLPTRVVFGPELTEDDVRKLCLESL